jgi:hypothetical protein
MRYLGFSTTQTTSTWRTRRDRSVRHPAIHHRPARMRFVS